MPRPALAEAAYSGTDAAFVDWAVKSCGLKSTDTAHQMAEAARTKAADAFNRQYMQQFRSEAFAAAADDKAKRDRLCRDIKEWYGKNGTRVRQLLLGDGETAQQPGTSTSRPGKSQEGGGKGGGRGRRHGGG